MTSTWPALATVGRRLWWAQLVASVLIVGVLFVLWVVPTIQHDAEAERSWKSQDDACWADPACDIPRWEHQNPEPRDLSILSAAPVTFCVMLVLGIALMTTFNPAWDSKERE